MWDRIFIITPVPFYKILSLLLFINLSWKQKERTGGEHLSSLPRHTMYIHRTPGRNMFTLGLLTGRQEWEMSRAQRKANIQLAPTGQNIRYYASISTSTCLGWGWESFLSLYSFTQHNLPSNNE